MALRGNLKDFSLPDVFQLVQLSGKTGVLRIAGPEAEGSIWFRDGDVFFAQSNWRREQLGERLVAAQRITPAALARALELREAEGDGGRRLGEILVNEGYITQQVLETFVQEQIQDTIFDLMRWDEGEFDFHVLPEVVDEDIGLSVSVENIVMEGSRRLEEWQRIKKKVPSTEMVFKMATAPGEGTFEISLKPVEWALLLLIDGTRSVRDLALETRSTDFEVARVVYGLFSAGLLEVPSDDEVDRLRADRVRREERRAAFEAGRTGDVTPAGVPAPVEPVAEPAAIAPEPAAPGAGVAGPHVPEEPEFLAMGGEPPSSDDMAVFEQMMASVLTQPGAETSPEATADTRPMPAYDEPVSPEDEPFVPAEAPVPGLDYIPEPEVGADYLLEAEPVTPAAGWEAPFDVEPGVGAIPAAEVADIPAPPIADEPAVARTGDFEADLRSLGLGELPEELLAPAYEAPAPAVEEVAPYVQAVPGQEPSPYLEPLTDESPPSGPEAAGGDLDSLLASLGDDGAAAGGVISSDVDYGATEEPGGYISTDVFLAEFDEGMGLSGGLADELTALTGGSAGRPRPTATVNRIPEAGEGPVLHRDQMVDKALLEKIIEGIENL